LLIRYKKSKKGKLVKQAEVYTAEEHGIKLKKVDPDAVRILHRLQRYGYAAYLVGGAVRDLILGQSPKDFDIATEAEPHEIRKLFRNSRIIGKRFRLVHVYFPGNKIIEVSTFRSEDSKGFDNIFGTLEEDVFRRDFSLNALYYNASDETVIDFVGGFKDIKKREIRAVIPLAKIFKEDPVRILRAIKYSVNCSCSLPFSIKQKIKNQSKFLEPVSVSRVTEEFFKLFASGQASQIFKLAYELKVLRYVLPELYYLLKEHEIENFRTYFFTALEQLDKKTGADSKSRAMILVHLWADLIYRHEKWQNIKKIHGPDLYKDIKHLMNPIIPANKDVETACRILISHRRYFKGDELPRFQACASKSHAKKKKGLPHVTP
jgi:poly(A) polymerase